MIIHVQNYHMWKRSVLQAERIVEALIPLLIMGICRCKASTRIALLRCIEIVDHVTGNLRQSAQMFEEEHQSDWLVDVGITRRIRVSVLAP